MEKQLWVIFLYTILSLFSDILLFYGIIPDNYTALYITSFVVLETILFTLYLILITQSTKLKKIITSVLVLFTLFSICYILTKIHYSSYSTIASLETIIVIVTCIIVFFEQISRPQSLFIYSTSSFWIIVGMLFYLAGIFFLSLLLPQLPKEDADKYWQLNSVFNIFKNISFTIAFAMKNSSLYNSRFPSKTYNI